MVQRRSSTLVRQKQIIDAARKLIIKYGSEHVTVRRIAKEIGISEGAIYKHFKSKRDVLSLLIDDIENTLLSEDELSPQGDYGTLEALEGTLLKHISHIVERRGVSFQVIAEIVSLGDKKLNKKVHNVIERYVARITDILSEGVRAGAVREDVDKNAAAILFFCLSQGLVNIWTLSQYSFDLKQEYAALWGVFRKSIIKPQQD